MTICGSVDVSLSGANPRPSIGTAPSMENRSGETADTWTLSIRSPKVQSESPPVVYTAIVAIVRLRLRQSTKVPPETIGR